MSQIWESDWTHDIFDGVRMADVPTANFLRQLHSKGHLSNSVLIFLSDHGFRFGEYLETSVGMMEANLPFFFLVLPPFFKSQFPELVANAAGNTRRLMTAFDIHKTLQHLLHLQTSSTPWSNADAHDDAHIDESLRMQKRVPKMQTAYSIFTPIPANRTCREAGIPSAFCACHPIKDIPTDGQDVLNAARALVSFINEALSPVRNLCVTWRLNRVVKARKRQKTEEYSLVVETGHGAQFQGWVEIKKAGRGEHGGHKGQEHGQEEQGHGHIIDLSQVSRLDKYGNSSACVLKSNYRLKEYCLCR